MVASTKKIAGGQLDGPRDGAGLLVGGRRQQAPFEHILEILEAGDADPSVLVERAISVMQSVSVALLREFRTAKFAMVVIPVRIVRISSIFPLAQFRPFEIFILAHETPV